MGAVALKKPRLTRQRAEALGLALCLGPGNAWPLACDLSSELVEERALGLAWHRKQVDLAAELGAVAYGGALYGHPGVVKRRIAPPDEYERIAEGLNRLAEYGRQRGVLVVIEPMSHFRTHIANTPQQIMRLAGMADHPNLRVALDTYHLVTEVRDYRAAAGWCRGARSSPAWPQSASTATSCWKATPPSRATSPSAAACSTMSAPTRRPSCARDLTLSACSCACTAPE